MKSNLTSQIIEIQKEKGAKCTGKLRFRHLRKKKSDSGFAVHTTFFITIGSDSIRDNYFVSLLHRTDLFVHELHYLQIGQNVFFKYLNN